MQIHEVTLVQEGLGDIARTIGSDIKNAVKAPFDKAKVAMNTPNSFTSARGYGDAQNKYYQGLVGQQQQADLTAWAKNLSSEWLKQPRPSIQTPTAQTQPAATVPAPKPTVAPAAPATPAKTPSYGPAYKNVTTNAPAGIPNPLATTGLPQPTTASTPTVATTPTPVTAPAVAKQRTGGKQPGVVSQTPSAIRQRNSRARATAPTGNSFGQMAQQLSGANKSASSTGGTTTQMPTGRFHAAKPQTAPAAVPDTVAAKTAPKWLTPTTKMTKSSPGKPTADEYEKLQQKIAAADAKQRGLTNEAFADLPGAKPAAGGAVAPEVTAKPPGIKAPPPLQSRYAQNFKNWAASKVEDKSSGLGLADVEKMPDMSRGLNQALVQVVATQQDPKANQTAVEQYLVMVGQAMQKLSSAQRKLQREKNPSSQVSSLTPLSKVLTSDQIENIKKMSKDPATAYQIKTALGLT
jgi:hypothetical protein